MHAQDLKKNVKIIPLDKILTHNLPEDCKIDMELLRMDICEKEFSIFDSFTIRQFLEILSILTAYGRDSI